MTDEIKIGLCGGDRRMLATAECLSEKYECAVWGLPDTYGENERRYIEKCVRCVDCFSAVRESDIVILPLPCTVDGENLFVSLESGANKIKLSDICSSMKKGATILGGMIPPLVIRYADEFGLYCIDYFDREEMQILNAVPTAEGAICACMERLYITVSGMRAVVTGYGRIARTLALRLKLLGADVFAVARSKRDLAWARCDGCIPIELSEYLNAPLCCDAVFNTIPSMIYDGELLSKMNSDTVIFELASNNRGVDTASAEKFGINVVSLPSLPGKTSPDTAGAIICEVIGGIISDIL